MQSGVVEVRIEEIHDAVEVGQSGGCRAIWIKLGGGVEVGQGAGALTQAPAQGAAAVKGCLL
ncbi:MAG: hypothetical protein K2L05_09435 [Muribaculaceae bacterium]|nr:hypothetical protein [Muribaculaceae bacterium]